MVGVDSSGSLPSPKVLRCQTNVSLISITRLSLSLATYSTVFFYLASIVYLVLQHRNKLRFGLFPFRSPLTKGISFGFFSSGYLDVSVLRVTYRKINFSVHCNSLHWGYPIRTPPGHRIVAPHRRLSRPYTSFFGTLCQGIHYMLLLSSLILKIN